MKKISDLKIGLIGAGGRLGKEIAALHKPAVFFTRESPAYAHSEVDVYIDVSAPEALAHNIGVALSAKKPLVVGTTGHATLSLLLEAAHKIPIFYSPNFSLGLALMRKFSAELARKFHRDAHIDLIETHHSQKKDSPSGSALLLAKAVEEHHPATVNIHSIRSGHIAGQHTLFFNTTEEKLTISHEAHSRTAFAKGALTAAFFLKDKPVGLYGMDELLA